MARNDSGRGRVFAYEANPDLEACIRETYALNQVQPALEMCAVGAHAAKPLSEIVGLAPPTLLIVDVEGAESGLFDHARLPTVTRIVLELLERVIGAGSARRVQSTLAAMGFEVLPDLTAGDHLLVQRVSGGPAQ